jgi:hypothetical protein
MSDQFDDTSQYDDTGQYLSAASPPPPVPPGGQLWPSNDNPRQYDSDEEADKALGNLQVTPGWNIGRFEWDPTGEGGKWYIGIWPDQ